MFLARLEWSGGTETVSVPSSVSLLEGILRAGIPMQNHCRRGDCQRCACRILEGQFSCRVPQEKAVGVVHLACQIEPLSDLSVALFDDPYELVDSPKFSPAKVVRIAPLSYNTVVLSLVLPRSQVFRFRPGQYVDIKLKSGLARPYSIAGYDEVSRTLDFHVRLINGGHFSSALRSAKEGELVQIQGPLGRFFLRDRKQIRSTVMLATGTGISPLYCILSNLSTEQSRQLGSVSIIWGNRKLADNYFDQQIADLARAIGADYRPVYSSETGAAFNGRVTNWLPSSFSETQVFAAGHPQMIADLRLLAHKRGLPPDLFHADVFSLASHSAG